MDTPYHPGQAPMSDGRFPRPGTRVVAVGASSQGLYARGNSGIVHECDGAHPKVIWDHNPAQSRETNSAKLQAISRISSVGKAPGNSRVLHLNGKAQLDGILQ